MAVKINRKRKIVASLELGKVLSLGWIIFLYTFDVLSILLVVGLIFAAFFDSSNFLFYLCGILFAIAFFLIVIRLTVRFVKIKKQVTLWAQDAIELTATSVYVSTKKNRFISFGASHMINIRVSFKYGGKHKRQTSIYDSIFRKYCDREIKILYSVKYDRIMIIG